MGFSAIWWASSRCWLRPRGSALETWRLIPWWFASKRQFIRLGLGVNFIPRLFFYALWGYSFSECSIARIPLLVQVNRQGPRKVIGHDSTLHGSVHKAARSCIMFVGLYAKPTVAPFLPSIGR